MSTTATVRAGGRAPAPSVFMCKNRETSLVAEPPATNEVSRFLHIKTLILADFLWKKDRPVPAVSALTIWEYAKMF